MCFDFLYNFCLKNFHVKYPLFLSDFNEMNFLDRFSKKLKYQVLSKSVQWEPSYFMRTDGHDEANSQSLFTILRMREKPSQCYTAK